MRLSGAWGAVAALLVACGGSSDGADGVAVSAASEGAATSASDNDGVLAALGDAGLKVGPFETSAARPYQATACVRGEIEELDVLLCSYADEAQAKAAQATLREFVHGSTTAVIRQGGARVMGIADRKQVDPKGQRLNKIVKAFSG